MLAQLKDESEILIIDTPLVLAVTDAVVLAPLVDGVLIVVAPGRTKGATARAMIEQLQRSKAKILGVVVKFMDGSGRRYSLRYGYANRYYQEKNYYQADE